MDIFGRFPVRKLCTFSLSLLSISVLGVLSPAQTSGSAYIARLERQTREENVCMLVQQNGQYHLERTAAGRARVFEGFLEASAIGELRTLLNAQGIVDLKSSQIDMTQTGGEADQVMITIPRATGWQKLTF